MGKHLCEIFRNTNFEEHMPTGGSGEKSLTKDMKIFFFQLSNLSQFFLLENPTHRCLETAVCPISVKPVLDMFGVCSLVPSMNLSHTQQSYLCPKIQNYLLEKSDLKFFLNYGLRTTIQITIFRTFYVSDNFSSCYSRNSCKKIQTLSIKFSSK